MNKCGCDYYHFCFAYIKWQLVQFNTTSHSFLKAFKFYINLKTQGFFFWHAFVKLLLLLTLLISIDFVVIIF